MPAKKKMGRPVTVPEGDSFIAQTRADLGLSQAALAEKLGVDRTTITHWEKGRYPASKSAIIICKSLLASKKGDEKKL